MVRAFSGAVLPYFWNLDILNQRNEQGRLFEAFQLMRRSCSEVCRGSKAARGVDHGAADQRCEEPRDGRDLACREQKVVPHEGQEFAV